MVAILTILFILFSQLEKFTKNDNQAENSS